MNEEKRMQEFNVLRRDEFSQCPFCLGTVIDEHLCSKEREIRLVAGHGTTDLIKCINYHNEIVLRMFAHCDESGCFISVSGDPSKYTSGLAIIACVPQVSQALINLREEIRSQSGMLVRLKWEAAKYRQREDVFEQVFSNCRHGKQTKKTGFCHFTGAIRYNGSLVKYKNEWSMLLVDRYSTNYDRVSDYKRWLVEPKMQIGFTTDSEWSFLERIPIIVVSPLFDAEVVYECQNELKILEDRYQVQKEEFFKNKATTSMAAAFQKALAAKAGG